MDRRFLGLLFRVDIASRSGSWSLQKVTYCNGCHSGSLSREMEAFMYGASKDSLYLILCDIAVFGNPVYGFGPEAEVARIKMGVFPYVCGHTGHVRCQPAVFDAASAYW